MSEFVASNGICVRSESRITGDRRLVFSAHGKGAEIEMTGAQMLALIETLDHEHDTELGRWRWPKNRHLVVYADEDGDVTVLNEELGRVSSLIIRADLAMRDPSNLFTKAARAYFDEHPEPKPWHNAKAHEIWTISRGPDERYFPFRVDGRWFTYIEDENQSFAVDDAQILDARRIYPEPS